MRQTRRLHVSECGGRRQRNRPVRFSAPAATESNHLAVRAHRGLEGHQVATAPARVASVTRSAPFASEGAADRVLEVRIDGRIEDKINGEVDRLQQVSHRYRDVEDLRLVARLNGQVNEKVHQFRRDEQDDEKDYDHYEGEGDTMGGLLAALAGGPPRCCRPDRLTK